MSSLLKVVPMPWPLQYALPGMLVFLPEWEEPVAIKRAEYFLNRDGEVRDVVLCLEENDSPWGYVEYTLAEVNGLVVIIEVRVMRRVYDAPPITNLNELPPESFVAYDGTRFTYDSRGGGVQQDVTTGNVMAAVGYSSWTTFKVHGTHLLVYADWGQEPPLATYKGRIVAMDVIEVHLAPAPEEAQAEEAAAINSDQS